MSTQPVNTVISVRDTIVNLQEHVDGSKTRAQLEFIGLKRERETSGFVIRDGQRHGRSMTCHDRRRMLLVEGVMKYENKDSRGWSRERESEE